MKIDRLEFYKAVDGWRWRYTAGNGRVLADSGQGYSRLSDAKHGANRVLNSLERDGLRVEVTK